MPVVDTNSLSAGGVNTDGDFSPSSNAWPFEPSSHAPLNPPSDRSGLSSSSEEDTSPDSSDHEHYPDADGSFELLNGSGSISSSIPTDGRRKAHNITPQPPKYPVFSRASSMPLPSQLNHLQNPLRRPGMGSRTTTSSDSPPCMDTSQFHELSLELADSVQSVIQTMLQVSPSQLLDPAKEQFSACSLSIPTPSMSAMFTVMKNLNYMSAHMASFCSQTQIQGAPGSNGIEIELPSNALSDFDVGEMLQSCGDALSGVAAQAGVDLVLFHGDVGMKHFCAKGDENGLSYALCHIIRQVLGTARKGDAIEVGLFINTSPPKRQEFENGESTFDEPLPSPMELDGPLRCTFDIAHKFGASLGTTQGDDEEPRPEIRPIPGCESLLLRRLLHQINATLAIDLPPRRFAQGRTCELQLTLEPGLPTALPPSVSGMSDNCVSNEPTLEELVSFAETLRGKKVSLYASVKGSFAHHLTSYLTAWGLDVSHISSETEFAEENVDPSLSPVSEPMSRSDPMLPKPLDRYPSSSSLATVTENPVSAPPSSSFLIIDDDVSILRQRLQELRSEPPYPLYLNSRKRPSLAAHHRPRSSPHVIRAMGHAPPRLPIVPLVILHFTSLSNYKVIKDVIQSALTAFSGTNAPIPEVMIIPKPAGPRRVLTALHTAVTRPIVDPFFAPIATSPMSPGLHAGHSFFHSFANSNSPRSPSQRPQSSRSNSDRSQKSTNSSKEFAEHVTINTQMTQMPPSPLGMTESLEYFSETSAKLGNSPSSGFVIQSPDGQPAGIFFHPRAKNNKNTSGVQMERNKGQMYNPSGERKTPTNTRIPNPRRPSSTNVTFASLHNVGTPTLIPAESPKPATVGLGLDVGEPNAPRTLPSPALTRKSSTQDVLRKASSPPSSPLAEGSTPSTQPRRQIARRVTPESKTPASGIAAVAKKGKAPDGNIIPPISVLVVDDNPINQTILTTFMKKKRIKYDVAMNGQEAVQKWRTGGFHLILMDIQMPIMDGIQATKEIRRLERLNAQAGYPPSTPSGEDPRPSPLGTPSDISMNAQGSPYRSSVIIVALTASSLQSDRVAALAAGCNDFLTKPVSLLWLNNKIIEWGSIKALQMWADIRTDVAKTLSTDQAVKALSVAEKLHVPKGRRTPSPSRSAMLLSEAGGPSNVAKAAPSPVTTPVAERSIPTEVERSMTPTQAKATNGNAPSYVRKDSDSSTEAVSPVESTDIDGAHEDPSEDPSPVDSIETDGVEADPPVNEEPGPIEPTEVDSTEHDPPVNEEPVPIEPNEIDGTEQDPSVKEEPLPPDTVDANVQDPEEFHSPPTSPVASPLQR